LSLCESFPDLVTVVGAIDESLFADLVLVGGLLFVVFIVALVTCCGFFSVIGLRGCTCIFSAILLCLFALILFQIVDFVRRRRHKVV
jgi:hypothetical protein